MSHAPITGRWTPVPDQALLALQRAKNYAAVIVWINMLGDAVRRQSWITSRPVSAIVEETRLSKTTVRKAQCDLVAAGLATVVSGGGNTRRKTTFALTPISSYSGKAQPPDAKEPKPTKGDWTL